MKEILTEDLLAELTLLDLLEDLANQFRSRAHL